MPVESMKVVPERSSVSRSSPGCSSARSSSGSTVKVLAISNSPSTGTVASLMLLALPGRARR